MSTTIAVICICASIILAGMIAKPNTLETDFRLKEIRDQLDQLNNRLKEIGDHLHYSLEGGEARLSGILDELRKLQDRETEE